MRHITLLLTGFVAVSAVAEESDVSKKILDTMVITATQTKTKLKDRSESIGVIGEQTIEDTNPTHAADTLNRIAGVNIVQLGSGSQGVAAAIRQPISYGPVYLYLENGVPVRSPAFFNHNSLYETNFSEAHGAEILKGPGSALYGSDAIGGVVNILSNQPITHDRQQLTLESGSDEWRRLQFKSDNRFEQDSLSIRLGVIDSEGWRQHTAVDRQNALINWQTSGLGFDEINSLFSYTQIDMDTGGSGLRYEDFINNSQQAGNLIGFREVESYRLSSALHKDLASGRLTITPYVRSNDLQYMATWTLNTGREVFIPWLGQTVLDSQDAHINHSGHDSIGALLRYQQDSEALNGFWIVGVDLDKSEGYTQQTYIERTDNDPGNYWLAYQTAGLLYDYEVDFTSVSPYLHMESDITNNLRVNAGLRYDSVRYDYDNHLSTVTSGSIHLRPADTQLSMDHLSPKLGLTYQWSDDLSSYVSYRNAFRIPSSGQLFRSGKTLDSTSLKPVVADSFDIGIRGNLTDEINFELALYHMVKDDDIVSLTEADGSRRNANVGETQHQGLELGLDYYFAMNWQLGLSYTTSRHEFKQWQVSDSDDFSRNRIPLAPTHYTNLRLAYMPDFLNGGRIELEGIDMGGYFVDEANTDRYSGHSLLNIRTNYYLGDSLELYLNILNATDKLYAETTSKWGPTYTPGKPRTAYLGLRVNF
ncbi:TonB-dependent receptor [Kangiella geojedonensis]|uniref:TonB-dependent receptor n=1 Tax=Kangiella geojedonensis TaxID=914150 RepID=A0A0F6TS48_9GAMM|nr:TonB-dependent receptor [Kangiella geojedonensis]AKE52667.1 TonB-dependent receptor [Kangiella geojedonensis]